MFRLVRHVRAAILHLGDPRIGIMRVLPFLVRTFLLALAVQAGQLFARRVLDPGRLRQVFEIVVIFLAVIPPHQGAQCRIGFQHGGIDGNRLAFHQPFFGQDLQHPPKNGLVGFHRI